MCTADSKFIRKMCTANSYEFVTHYEVKLLFLGYFLINELVQNMIGLTIKHTVCQKNYGSKCYRLPFYQVKYPMNNMI